MNEIIFNMLDGKLNELEHCGLDKTAKGDKIKKEERNLNPVKQETS